MAFPIIAALAGTIGRMAAGGVAEFAATTLGRSAVTKAGGQVLENTLLTNAKSITSALFGQSSKVVEAAAATTRVASKAAAAPSGTTGGAAKFLSGDWSPGSAIRDAMLYGKGGGSSGPSDGMGDRMAAVDRDNRERENDARRNRQFESAMRRQNLMDMAKGVAVTGGTGLATRAAMGGAPWVSSKISGMTDAALNSPRAALGLAASGNWSFIFGKAMTDLAEKSEGASLGLLASQSHLARFNASIAANSMALERHNIMLSFQSARNTAGSNTSLTNSTIALQDSLQPFKDASTNFENLFQSGKNRMIDGLVNTVGLPFKAAVKLFNQSVNKFAGSQDQNANGPVGEFVEILSLLGDADAQARRAHRRRPKV